MGSKKKKLSAKVSATKETEASAAGDGDRPAKSQQLLEGKSAKDEIEAIFGKRKKRKAGVAGELPEDGAGDESPVSGTRSGLRSAKKGKGGEMPSPVAKKESRKMAGKSGGAASGSLEERRDAKPRKKTTDGLTVYAEDELKWNLKDAGGTPLCPFDCECCF